MKLKNEIFINYINNLENKVNEIVELTINKIKHQVTVELNTPLLWFLRDTLNLTGTKYGCGIQQCGACTVLIKGRTVRSCGVTMKKC